MSYRRQPRPALLPKILGGIAFAIPVLMYAKLMHWSHTNGMIGPAPVSRQLLGGLLAIAVGAVAFLLVWGLTTLIVRFLSDEEPDDDGEVE